jgi:predicted heme/steroid binding protein
MVRLVRIDGALFELTLAFDGENGPVYALIDGELEQAVLRHRDAYQAMRARAVTDVLDDAGSGNGGGWPP